VTVPHALLVAGPTASGKSALALALAERLRGTIINADSMQVYRELRVLTARPTPGEEAQIPHTLYGVRPAAQPGSVAWWRTEALLAMRAAHDAGRLPILAGGTGLYFASLTQGLADIPDPGPTARAEARALLRDLGAPALHARLAAVDPATAASLKPNDSQRVARAWEVWRGTGTGLAAWQAQSSQAQSSQAQSSQAQSPHAQSPQAQSLQAQSLHVQSRQPWSGQAKADHAGSDPTHPASLRFTAILLDPPRDELRAAIATRFAAMLAEGAPDEVRGLLAQHLDPSLPAMRAHGVPELSAYLRNEITLEEAGRRTELVTGQYTKRQATWFRHHPLADRTHTIHARFAGLTQFSERKWDEIVAFVQAPG
jgi:tRNA dimethylallyltransferase